MSTLPPPAVKAFPEDSIEKQCYGIAESLKDFLPIPNDRNRLGFNLYRLAIGEGDTPEVIVKNAKLKVEGISFSDLAKKIEEEMAKIKKL
jgi:hypothetical protein